jgi:type IV secretion system protein VirB8
MSKQTEELDFELKISDILQKSNKRAWIITFVSIILLCGVIFLYLFKPLVVTEPFVIQVDKATGLTEMLSSVSEKNIEYSEAIDKFFTSQYVKKREQYFYSFLSKDYVYVQLNSTKKVAEDYIKIYAGKESRDKVLGEGTEEIVKVLSVALGENAYIKNATVRIKVNTKKKGMIVDSKIKIVTLAYTYMPALKASEKERLLNPLGFKVTSYRVDAEVK